MKACITNRGIEYPLPMPGQDPEYDAMVAIAREHLSKRKLVQMEDGTLVSMELIYGSSELRRAGFIEDEYGRWAEVYERIDKDQYGNITARRMLEPVCWMSVQ